MQFTETVDGDPANPMNTLMIYATAGMAFAPVQAFADVFTNGALETVGVAYGGSGKEALIQETFAAAPAPDAGVVVGLDAGAGIDVGSAITLGFGFF